MKFKNLTVNLFFVALIGMTMVFSSSCSKDDDDCTDNVVGTYEGTEACPGANTNLTLVITDSSQDDQVVISVSGSTITFNGDLSSNCSQITIESQNVAALGSSIDGSFSVNGNTLSGNLNYTTGSCAYTLTKQ